MGWLCVLQAPTISVELCGSHAQVRQKIGNQRHIRDCRKALDETSQTITFNWGESVGPKELLMNLDYLWQYLA